MIIQSTQVWVSSRFIPAQIELDKGIIKRIYPYGENKVDKDYKDLRIIPGMIDVHCHGGVGVDTNDSNPEGLVDWSKALLKEGITSFCPTTITQSVEVLSKAVETVADVKDAKKYGAEILGIHFEGPYLNMANKGAQPPEYIVKPDVEQFKMYQKKARNNIKVMTVACENDDNFELTRYASRHGVNVSIGHSGATFEQACMAVANGATSMTHTYNGMNGLHHRKPNLVGAAMTLKTTYSEIICDGNHVVWPAINVLVMSKGPDYCLMIDDALSAKGCEPGKHDLGGQTIEVRANGSAYLSGTDTLAGGTLKFNKGIQNLIEKAQVPIDYAINMATLNPARYLHVDDRKGRIGAGYDGDLVVLDRDYEVVDVYCRGELVD